MPVIDHFLLSAGSLKREWEQKRRGEAPMPYHFSTIVGMSFDDAVASTKEALKRRKLKEINMRNNLNEGMPFGASK